MSMILIEGHYEVVGSAPDGDSIKFYPAKKSDWKYVREGHAVRSNQRGGAQLRLDAVDALETHYTPTMSVFGTTHQPHDLARGAASEALSWLGFDRIQRDERELVTAATPSKTPGYILTRFGDAYGRCVAFAFKGYHGGKTGDELFFDVRELKDTLNYHLLLKGFAYPTYYAKLYVDLRREMTKAVVTAREHQRGVWAKDKSISGYRVGTLAEVQDDAYVVPKLYRRMLDYVALNSGDTSLDGFGEYLAERNDRLFILSEGQFTGFHYIVKTEGQTVRMTKPIEDLVFAEK